MMENNIPKIRERAFEIYEYRQEYGMTLTTDQLGNLREITPQDDWLEAEEIILGELAGNYRSLT
jgi:hypothetical protein